MFKKKKENINQGSDVRKQAVTSLEKQKVDVNSLHIGMYVCQLDRPWEDTPFLFQGFLLRDKETVTSVQDICGFVYIDVARTESSARTAVSSLRKLSTQEESIDSEGENFTTLKCQEERVAKNASKIASNIVSQTLKKTQVKTVASRGTKIKSQKGHNSLVSNEGSCHEIVSRIAMDKAALTSFTLGPTAMEKHSSEKIKVDKTRPKTVPMEAEIERASSIFTETSSLVKNLMEEARMGNSLDTQAAKTAVSECVNSLITNPDAMVWLTQLKNKDAYTSEHSLNVCLLSIAFGRHLGMPIAQLETLGLCGMLHDIGKMQTPLEVLNKPGNLTASEFEIMSRHPADGAEILLSGGGMPNSVVHVALSHHEWLSGTGYPKGLKAEKISSYTKMVAVVDAYDAITSSRVYDKGRTHMEALQILAHQSGTHFDTDYVIQFIECISIFPPGCIVELSTGEIAIVTEVNEVHKLLPKIVIILDKYKKPCVERSVDLTNTHPDLSGKPCRIKRVVPASEYDINVHHYHKKQIVLNATGA